MMCTFSTGCKPVDPKCLLQTIDKCLKNFKNTIILFDLIL